MPVSPSSSAQQARQVLGERLREIRLAADIQTARALAAACRWHESKVSRIEHGRQLPSESDLRTWCWACRAEDRLAELIGMARAVDSMYADWRRLHSAGLAHVQDGYTPLYERTRNIRYYQSSLIPGMLQTPEYAYAVLTAVANFRNLPDDVDEAVAARMARNAVLREPGRTFAFLIEESVLRARLADADVLTGQLGRLLIDMTLPNVSVGVIPLNADRTRWITESFTIHGEEMVEAELVSARVRVTQRAEVAQYTAVFAELSKLALHGGEARRLVTAAIDALG